MVTCTPDVKDGYHYILWIAQYFGDCIYTPKDIASFTIGLLSICVWIPAQVPQIWMNFRQGRVEAIHPLFLINWALGDSTNLAGCFLTGQLATQLYTAIYFCALDVIMLTQYAYYQVLRPKCCPRWEKNAKMLTAVTVVVSTVSKAAAYPMGLMSVPVNHSAVLATDSSALVGVILGWVSAAMYLLARLPQIIRNFQRGQLDGLSWKMFMFAMMGNSLYGLSIFLRSLDPQFLMDRLPWLVGSLGTLMFDTTIIIQFIYFSRKNAASRYLVVNEHEPVTQSDDGSSPDVEARIKQRELEYDHSDVDHAAHEEQPLLRSTPSPVL